MAKSFREMVTWQLAFELRQRIVALMAKSPQARKDFEFRDQIHDSSKSVPSNIAEGYGRYRPAESIRFLDIASGSLEETENHLRDGVECRYFNAEEVGPLIRLVARCRTAMNRWRAYLETVRNDPRFSKSPRRRRKPLNPSPRENGCDELSSENDRDEPSASDRNELSSENDRDEPS